MHGERDTGKDIQRGSPQEIWNSLSIHAQEVSLVLRPELTQTSQTIDFIQYFSYQRDDNHKPIRRNFLPLTGLRELNRAGVLQRVTYLQELHERFAIVSQQLPPEEIPPTYTGLPAPLTQAKREYSELKSNLDAYYLAEKTIREMTPQVHGWADFIDDYNDNKRGRPYTTIITHSLDLISEEEERYLLIRGNLEEYNSHQRIYTSAKKPKYRLTPDFKRFVGNLGKQFS